MEIWQLEKNGHRIIVAIQISGGSGFDYEHFRQQYFGEWKIEKEERNRTFNLHNLFTELPTPDSKMPQPTSEIDTETHDCKILGTKAVTDLTCIRLCKYHNNICHYVENKKRLQDNETKFKICPRCNTENPTDFGRCKDCLESIIDVEITSGEGEEKVQPEGRGTK